MARPIGIVLAMAGIGAAFACHDVRVGSLGIVSGIVDHSKWTHREFCSFRGIPFAENPTGALRFAPPVAIRSWTNGLLNATAFGNICPQTKQPGYGVESFDEDCLNLNVYVPRNAKKLLPVIVWLHGGGFVSGHSRRYEPHYFMESDVILVVPQFRLGIMGLLAFETEDVPGNVQFLDQIEALRWVNRNIEYFGGSKDNVTLAGQSSGASAVGHILLNPSLATGLFHRTIIQSAIMFNSITTDANPLRSTREIAEKLNCGGENKTLITLCLKRLSAERILRGYDEFIADKSKGGYVGWGGNRVVIQHLGNDLTFLSDDPSSLVLRGDFVKLPMIAGSVEQEGSYLVCDIYDLLSSTNLLTDSKFLKNDLVPMILRRMNIEDGTGFISYALTKQYFPASDEPTNFVEIVPGLIDMLGTLMFKAGSYRMLRENSQWTPSYLYSFDYRGSRTRFGYETGAVYPFDGGVSHSDDNIYLFPFPNELSETDREVSRRMIQLWTSFATHGVPSADDVAEWPKFSIDNPAYLTIDYETTVSKDYTREFTATIESASRSSASIHRFSIIDTITIAATLGSIASGYASRQRWYLENLFI